MSSTSVPSSSVSVLDVLAISIEEINSEASLQLATADAKFTTSSSQVAVLALPTSNHSTEAAAGSQVEEAIVQSAPGVVPESKIPMAVDVATNSTASPILKQGNTAHTAKAATVDTWCTHAKGLGKRLSRKGEAFTLPSGEACIKIPNSIIEKSRKSWEPFVLGQFYSDPPSQGTLHNIANGIWSKHYRDISV